ncbi:unnamed protein product [Prorocentrum cordatum]|uniref:Uncharacterized protein n=1 Tax=Prorocentrum cordatum TaxID=2364126 RepID=A0ABN9WYZ8_9DINO|nr:unnamed protein product [Polarella glacialis]
MLALAVEGGVMEPAAPPSPPPGQWTLVAPPLSAQLRSRSQPTAENRQQQEAVTELMEMPTQWVGANSTKPELPQDNSKKEKRDNNNKSKRETKKAKKAEDLFDIFSDDEHEDYYLDGDDAADGWACWHRGKVPEDPFTDVSKLNMEAFAKTECAREARLALWRLKDYKKYEFEGDEGSFKELTVAHDSDDIFAELAAVPPFPMSDSGHEDSEVLTASAEADTCDEISLLVKSLFEECKESFLELLRAQPECQGALKASLPHLEE